MTTRQSSQQPADTMPELSERDILLKLSADMTGIKSDMETLKNDVTDIKESLQFSGEEINELKEKVKALEVRLVDKSKEVVDLSKRVTQLENRQDQSELYSQKYNLIFENIGYEPRENLESKLKQLWREKMRVVNSDNILIDNIHRLQETKPNGLKPVIVRFVRFTDRMAVWSQRTKLKCTNIYVREHLPPAIAYKQRSLMPVFKAMKSSGERVSLVGDYIVHNKRRFTTTNVHHLYPYLDGKDPCATDGETVYAYFGRHSPLSNFYRCEFKIDDRSYNCVEQAYQEEKARHYNRDDIASAISTCSDPVDMKKLGDALEGDDWYNSGAAIEAMKKIASAKFQQCEAAKNTLVYTGSRKIAEASAHDVFWGILCSRFNPECQLPDSWKGQNQMGRILETIRRDLLS